MNEVEHLRQQLRPAQDRVNAAEERSDKTTLPKFLKFCHKLFSEPFKYRPIGHLPPRAQLRALVGRYIPPTYARGKTFPNCNSITSIELTLCCALMIPALARLFPHAAPLKTSDTPFVVDHLPARKLWNLTNVSQYRKRSQMWWSN